ncbi:transketolase-like TK C-terminal-containing protein [Thioclava nitratireducens]|uniref:transketolase-like TK C-terminal-containing protein n=1 Tax=Thioclava nitratireducens TaxID=1915078 RepID=UPI0024492BB7|nr:transketolase C-terminal domain-containing protein [Thioclava nitratireducens]
MFRCDGHDAKALDEATAAKITEIASSSLTAMKTVIGFGSPNRAGTAKAHGATLGDEKGALAKQALGWNAAPFEIPEDLAASWVAIGVRGTQARAEWEDALAASGKAAKFTARVAGKLPEGYAAAIEAARADLADSNLTRVASVDSTFAAAAPDHYIGYGVRESGMAGAMNGLALHGGFKPYGGTFLVLSVYSRNAIRLSVLIGLGVTCVMTHASIGLGEDSPTHQPVEHLASLRAIPNLNVFRAPDAVETLELWDLAIRSTDAPSLLALSRQGVPQLRGAGDENLTARGAYVIRSFGEGRDVTLLATGTEVALAVEAAEALHAEGHSVAVVSMPCWELFDAQPEEYRAEVLGAAPRVAVEAASAFGWTRYVAREADVIGMPGFGASAPAEQLYAEFGITADAVAARSKALIAG